MRPPAAICRRRPPPGCAAIDTSRPPDPDAFTHSFKRLAAKVGLDPSTRLHDARHGVATTLPSKGTHPGIATAEEALGDALAVGR